MANAYTYIWEFLVASDSAAAFERHYGVDGTWAALFRRAPGYLGTALLVDRTVAGRYLTLDRWESEQAYSDFRRAFAAEYAELDARFEQLTHRETFLGAFTE